MGIKDNLEAKVRELNSLVEDLGKLQRGGNGKTSLGHPGASSEEHCRAQKPAKLDVAADQEGKLPTIDENKSYPRESLRYGVHSAKNVMAANKLSDQKMF